MQANSWHHKAFHFHLFILIWKVLKGEKLQKSEYLEIKKSFLDDIKRIFHSFLRAIIWSKPNLTYLQISSVIVLFQREIYQLSLLYYY